MYAIHKPELIFVTVVMQPLYSIQLYVVFCSCVFVCSCSCFVVVSVMNLLFL